MNQGRQISQNGNLIFQTISTVEANIDFRCYLTTQTSWQLVSQFEGMWVIFSFDCLELKLFHVEKTVVDISGNVF